MWYKFISTSNTHSLNVSLPSQPNYHFGLEVYSLNNGNFKLIDGIPASGTIPINFIMSGLEIGQTYYIRLVFYNSANANDKNANFNICLNTPVIQTPVIKTRAIAGLYTAVNTYPPILNLSYVLPQNIPESDLSFDWRLFFENANGQIYPSNSFSLYQIGDTDFSDTTTTLTGISGRRVQLRYNDLNPGTQLWVGVEVRVRQISTNTYLTDWIKDSGRYSIEL